MHGEVRTRLFLPQAGSERIITTDEGALDIARVLKLRKDDLVGLFKDDPFDYEYRVESVTRRQLVLEYRGRRENTANPQATCVLVQASGKSGKNEEIVRHGTALGVTEFLFFRADRSIGRIVFDKAKRLQKIALESCRQCGRSRVPVVALQDQGLEPALDGIAKYKPVLIACIPGNNRALWRTPRENLAEGVVLVIGPEGGFSPDEHRTLSRKGAHIAGLGPRTLRMELASVVALALVQSSLNENASRVGSDPCRY